MSNHKTQFHLYLLLIIIGSSIPGKSVPAVFSLSWDKLLHICEYFVFGILGYRAYRFELKHVKIIVPIYGILFGCFDEAWQSLIPGRYPSHYDVIADGIGVIFGVIIMHYMSYYD